MIGFNVWFTKSTDHGATWSPPVKTYGNVSWNDKPILAVSDNGQDVYASFNGPTGGDPWVPSSHDAGATWSQVKLVDSARYDFTFDGDVDADGNVYFANSSLLYSSAGKQGRARSARIEEHIFISRGRGRHVGRRHRRDRRSPASTAPPSAARPTSTRGTRRVGRRQRQRSSTCTTARRPSGGMQYDLRLALDRPWGALDDAGDRSRRPARSRPTPMIESARQRRRPDRLDCRPPAAATSTPGTPGTAARPTAARRGRRRSASPTRRRARRTRRAAGYAEVYGDYGEMAITNTGKTIATWGEGISYTGPGGVWVNRER